MIKIINIFGKRDPHPFKPIEREISRLGSALIRAVSHCEKQITPLIPKGSEGSEPDVEAFRRRAEVIVELLSFFLSAVERASDLKGLTENQRNKTRQLIVPPLIDTAIDMLVPHCSDDVRDKFRSDIGSQVGAVVTEYNAIVGLAIYDELATNIERDIQAAHDPVIARNISLLARKQLREADFARLVDRIKKVI